MIVAIQIGLVFFLAFLLALRGTPVARDGALRFGIVDRPDGRLKDHSEPVPYLGGLAIFVSFLVSLALVFPFERSVLGLLLGGSIVVLVGLVDDFGVLTPTVKFLGQLLAVWCLMKSGIVMHLSFLPDSLNYLLTALWLVGITNAFNIIDIMDGLSAGVGVIASTFLLAVSIINGNESIAVITAALAGSLCGFLRYNYHPAKIYMGDAGSLFLGLMLGALSITGQYTMNHRFAFAAPVLLLGVPIYDTAYVMLLRTLRGRSMFFGSKDHVALRLRKLGLTITQTVNILYGSSLLLGLLAFALIYSAATPAMMILIGVSVMGLVTGAYLARIRME